MDIKYIKALQSAGNYLEEINRLTDLNITLKDIDTSKKFELGKFVFNKNGEKYKVVPKSYIKNILTLGGGPLSKNLYYENYFTCMNHFNFFIKLEHNLESCLIFKWYSDYRESTLEDFDNCSFIRNFVKMLIQMNSIINDFDEIPLKKLLELEYFNSDEQAVAELILEKYSGNETIKEGLSCIDIRPANLLVNGDKIVMCDLDSIVIDFPNFGPGYESDSSKRIRDELLLFNFLNYSKEKIKLLKLIYYRLARVYDDKIFMDKHYDLNKI
ncbi:MAG: hypothetical protein A2504_07050 [Bdellovibrionales bacterium RIFOXYD12_FULL_39_22]|nr:MAG: hypothetical protein A2385_05265 [Bdellovibrionales bacterium RIFOXYB1_FULL_39_21]OFZ44332.1 MAG: hypothetical protein A2485_16045 [Bdellovibrionales bacterium RIFOXYC12_FULL_39_17]OFZ49187.1 MAG: hypothetical protein A2404_15985 [Bdellovibrionales bacterium RIFOXYC1_FULL_39_130]OFZ76995.1 MAG: hypothetical protein A2560_11070 [Bdellovibrionales bacterium RIFOXYD1_FULL_39_84]OFZ95208.1 MAG: hypothetical protein A2504_07050 [Bdellovibrionales bacterium RIFOXYD12_FULL_39_22]